MNKPEPDKKQKLKRKDYEKKLHDLQVELCHLQDWVKSRAPGSSLFSRAAMQREKGEPSAP